MVNNLIVFEDKSLDPANIGGIQGHGGKGSKQYDEHIIKKLLVGETVRVYWSSEGHKLNSDFGWITSICIIGKLECGGSWYRVLQNDDTYTYFGFEDILTCAVRKSKPHSISLRSHNNQ